MLAETPPIAVEEGNRPTGISCEEIDKFDADERGDDVKSIAEHLNQCGRLTKKEHVAIIIAVRRYRQNPVGYYTGQRCVCWPGVNHRKSITSSRSLIGLMFFSSASDDLKSMISYECL